MIYGQDHTVECFEQYRQAILEVEKPFNGLPHVMVLLVKSLISLANPYTGIIEDISYSQLAESLKVNPAANRKNTGVPTKQSVRNYIHSIQNECGQYFKVITEGRSLKFLFTQLPLILKKVTDNTDCATHSNISKSALDVDAASTYVKDFNIQINTETNTKSPNEELYINNKTNNNTHSSASTASKQPIAPDFYPNAQTLSRALASGYGFAEDPKLIQEFIDKNTAWGSTFADFNPIYLTFLARHAERLQVSTLSKPHTRSSNSERTSSKVNSYDSALDEVRRNNAEACTPSESNLFPRPKVIWSEPTTCVMGLGRVNEDLWATVC